MPDSNTFVIVATEGDPTVCISQDSGKSWRGVSTLVHGTPGQVVQNEGKLYVNSPTVLVSSDTGHTWSDLCASPFGSNPSNPLAVINGRIYAGDNKGDLWVNRSGLPNGPRLRFDSNYTITAGAVFSIPLRTPHTFWNGFTADSVSVSLKFNTKVLTEKSVSPAPGWSVSQVIQDTDGIVLHLVRTSANIETDSTLASITFQTYLTPELSSTIALDEINWDRDTSFRDCIVSALSASDTVHVNLLLTCGDSTLLRFMATGSPFEFTGITPNPLSDGATISFTLAARSQVAISVIDCTGRETMVLQSQDMNAGQHEIKWDASRFASGVYSCRLTVGVSNVVKKIVLLR